MSLHKFAQDVASKGRGDDSLLIHMTPDEVQRLQKFAEANGRSLTINPDTGLPEAGMLSDLFKSIAPIALGAFLGPAGAAIGGGFLTAAQAGLAVGGITSLATGSLSRGLMAGLGAYGGAGLGDSLMKAGTGALSQSVGAGLSEEAAQQAVASKLASATPMETLTAGFNSATATPAAMGTFAKQNLGNISAAAAPIMAGAMVPTTTKMPEDTNPAYIRQKLYDPFTQTYKSLTPVKASEFGGRNFSDAYTNPQTGGIATLDQRQTTPMATGGIVALAGGGDAALEAYQAGNFAEASRLLGEAGMSAQDVVSKYGLSQEAAAAVAQNLGYTGDMGGIKYADPAPVAAPAATVAEPDYFAQQFAPDVSAPITAPTGIETLTAAAPTATATAPAQQPTGIETLTAPVAPTTPTYNKYTDEEIAKYLIANPSVDIAKAIKETNADPARVNAYIASLTAPFKGSTDTTGGSGTFGIYNQMKAQGIDPNELYSAATANDPKYAGYTQAMIEKAYNLDKGAYALSDQLKGVVGDKDWVKFMDDNKYSIDDAAQAFGLSRNEVRDRYNAVKDAEKKVVKPPTFTNPVTGGTMTAPTRTTTTVLPTDPTVNAPPGTKNPYGGPNTPGDKTYNPDGSITVTPNIPGRPYGGFSGMDEVKDAYTAGGGSLGYTPTAPKTPAEHAVAYNKMTGDSQAAYKYLMGQGANPVQSVAASTPTGIMRPYFSEGMRYKPKFLSYDKEGSLTTSETNPNAPKSGDVINKPGAKSINVVDNQGNTIEAVLREDGKYYTSGGDAYDVTGKQIVAGGGMMGYAVGGGLGSLGSYSDGGRLLKGPGDGVSDSIPATIGRKQQPARLADGEFVIPARIVSELGNGSTDAGAKKLYAMMDRVQRARGKTTGKNKVAANSRADKYLPA
jgi:hypothetical protein